MGLLIPEEFPMELLTNDAERQVVTALVDRLYDSWLVIPDVGMRDADQDRQSDIVLVHPDWGVLLVEVKGHRLQIRDGQWCGQEGTPLNPQPIKQALDNSYALARRIRRNVEGLDHLNVHFGLAFPNTSEIAGTIPMDFERDMMLLADDLRDLNDAIERMALLGRQRAYSGALNDEQVEAIVNLLRPDLDFKWDPDARADITRQRLDDYCDAQISSLISLMENRRVAVRGGAGTGKTKLAVQWAQRAWAEGDRVLLTCFNEPLADDFKARIGFLADPDPDAETDESDVDQRVFMVGAFLQLARSFPEIPPIESDGLYAAEWETKVWGALQHHWPKVTARFDTIVIDEAQDFHPAWIGMLESLLDPDGRRRILMVADQDQGIYGRGFMLPRADDGWVQAELRKNFRNAAPIAKILRRSLGGAESPAFVPEGMGVSFREVTDLAGAIEAVDSELERIVEKEMRDPKRVAVLTFRSAVRDALRKELGLGAWEDRHELVVCENIHRVKGLEFDTVILVATEPEVDDSILYVGVSRAVNELIVVVPSDLAAFLGFS